MRDEHGDISHEQRLDEATVRRLVRLRTMPVDLGRLKARVEAEIPRPVERAGGAIGLGWFRPMRAVAASLLVMGLIVAVVIASSSGPALASSERLLQVHQEMLAGPDHATSVQSLEAANAALAQQWSRAPGVPSIEHDAVMSCCVHRIGRQKVACVAMTLDGTPITMAVAPASDIKMPQGRRIDRNGRIYLVDSSQGVQMVMTERDGRWACLMGPLPVERLVEALETMRW
jgi:HAMP domain-containing protein